MKAVWYERNGAANDVLVSGEMPDPSPGPGEVRVRIAFSAVNPSDAKRRAGWNNQKLAFPRSIPNMDGSGVIDRVGEGIDAGRIGERVWLHSTAFKRPFGTAAEYAVTPGERAYPLPAGVSFAVGATLGVPAMTSHRAVFVGGPVCDKTVLVTGGAGAVGYYAIQFAKWRGARVIATVSSADKAALARSGGADSVLDYRRENVADAISTLTGGSGVDHVVDVDFGANLATTLAILKTNGSIAAYASMSVPQPSIPFYAMMTKNVRLFFVLVYEMPRAAMDAAAADIATWLQTDCFHAPPLHRFPLDRVADAHLAVEAATIGKVVVEVGGETVAT